MTVEEKYQEVKEALETFNEKVSTLLDTEGIILKLEVGSDIKTVTIAASSVLELNITAEVKVELE
jgi:archaellum component FlaF (FlaF/FlaG flagellin family)